MRTDLGLKLFPFELMDLVIVAIAENVVAAMVRMAASRICPLPKRIQVMYMRLVLVSL